MCRMSPSQVEAGARNFSAAMPAGDGADKPRRHEDARQLLSTWQCSSTGNEPASRKPINARYISPSTLERSGREVRTQDARSTASVALLSYLNLYLNRFSI